MTTLCHLNRGGNIPLEDNSINSIIIDLPFIISPKTAPSVKENKEHSNIIFKRFHSYYPYTELIKSYQHWIEESFRVLKDDGICVFKCQNNISGGKFYCSEEISWFFAQQCGFYVLDKFTCLAKARLISGKIKKQQHSRNFTSTFWVFKKKWQTQANRLWSNGIIVDFQTKDKTSSSPKVMRRFLMLILVFLELHF